MTTGFFEGLYPALGILLVSGAVLGIHLICQHYVKRFIFEQNKIRAFEFILVGLITYPFFLWAYPSDSVIFWLRDLISIPLIFFIPGYLLVSRIFMGNAIIRENRDSIESLFLQILMSILISGGIGLLLAIIGYFSLFSVDAGIICICSLILYITKSQGYATEKPQLSFEKTSYVLIAIGLLAMILFFHPFPWILGGRDPGVYVNTGISIANSGALLIHDPFLEELNTNEIQSFYLIPRIVNNTIIKNDLNFEGFAFPGYYITDSKTGELTPQFYYLWPTWIALFYSLFGMDFVLYVTPTFAILAIFAIFYATKTIFNTRVGLLTAFFLTINSAIIWYSRYPSSEIFTAFLIFSGVYTFILFKDSQNIVLGCISAFCFGEAFLTRIDAIILVIPILFILLYIQAKNKFERCHTVFLIILSAFIVWVSLIDLFIAYPYVNSIIYNVVLILNSTQIIPSEGYAYLILISTILFVVLTTVIFKSKIAPIIYNKFLPYEKSIRILLIGIIVLFIGYDYILKQFTLAGIAYTNSNQLFWYLGGSVGLVLSVCGCVLFIALKSSPNNKSEDLLFFLSIFLLYAFLFISNALVASDHPWWVRRFVPVVIPSVLICISYGIIYFSSLPTKHIKLQTIASICICGLLILPTGISDSKIIPFIGYNGAMEDLNNLSEHFDNSSIIFFPNNQLIEHYGIVTPLTNIFNKTMLQLQDPEGAKTVIYSWLLSEKPIYFIDLIQENDIVPSNFVTNSYTVSWPIYMYMEWNPEAYYFVPTEPTFSNHTFIYAKINSFDEIKNKLILTSGWEAREMWTDIPTRWISNNATLMYFTDGNTSKTLKFSSESFYQTRSLQIYVNGAVVNQTAIPTEIKNYSIDIPLQKEGNTIRFFIKEGCEIPANNTQLQSYDTRCISIAMRNITLE
jgi:hypothetical protein